MTVGKINKEVQTVTGGTTTPTEETMSRRIVKYNPDGKAQFAGTNVFLWKVIEAKNGGDSLDELSAKFPRLTMLDLKAADGYYAKHKEEVDADINEGSE